MLSFQENSTLTIRLLICGIFSSLLYFFEDLLAAILWPDYDITSMAFSDYSAIGASTRPLILIFSPIYSMLVIAFGLGILRSARKNPALRIIGILFIVYAMVNWVWPQFYPVHLKAAEAASSDFMHIVLTFVIVSSWLLILGFGAISFGKRFRFYSIITLLAVIGFGSLAGYIAGTTQSTTTLHAPWLGIVERINIYSFMIWETLFALILIRSQTIAKFLTPRNRTHWK